MIVSIAILALVTAQRLAELAIAKRNTRRLLALGGVEHGAGHYPLIIVLHAAWLAGLWVLAWDRPADPGWLAVYLILQGLRGWVLLSLGARWTTRIVAVPGEALVQKGPYRFLRHPNYAVVAGEIAVLPLVFGLWAYAAGFSLINAAVLWVRICAETAALHAAGPTARPRAPQTGR